MEQDFSSTQNSFSGHQQQHIPGYAGFIPGVQSENIFGKTYGNITQASSKRAHHRGSDLPPELRYSSLVFQEYKAPENPATSHIDKFNPLKRFGLNAVQGQTDLDRTRANYGISANTHTASNERQQTPLTTLDFEQARKLAFGK